MVSVLELGLKFGKFNVLLRKPLIIGSPVPCSLFPVSGLKELRHAPVCAS